MEGIRNQQRPEAAVQKFTGQKRQQTKTAITLAIDRNIRTVLKRFENNSDSFKNNRNHFNDNSNNFEHNRNYFRNN